MVKLLVCLLSGLALACVMLELRQQRRELAYQCTRLHNQIQDAQIKLWNQQLQIATYTAPNAIQQTIQQYDLTLVPAKPFIPVPDDDMHSDEE
jgi:hypothetical protein